MEKQNQEIELLLLGSFPSASEAELASEILRSGGIMCIIADSEIGGAMTAVGSLGGPADVFVKSDDLEKAKQILGL